jgi:galactokinase
MSDFLGLFGRKPVVQADAPGRVNLIGEHTDYNGGFVLPAPIPQRSRVELAPRTDNQVCVASGNLGGAVLEYTLGAETPGRGWLDYIQGVTHVLRAEGFPLRGFDAFIQSDVPVGSGLSSSAALDVSLMRALRAAFALDLEDLRLAQLGQRVENHFVGAQVGIMDPMACSLGEEGTALFIDARTLDYQRIPLPPGADLVVINSGVAHDHAAGDYNTRRAECERACSLLGIAQLRDLSRADLPRLAELPETLARRARHVITENDRVLATIDAMRAGDLICVGELFYASHNSQRDDYHVSVGAIDLLIDLARAEKCVYGARLTGGGFGGSIVLLAHQGQGRAVAERITTTYAKCLGHTPTILVPA